MDSNEPATKPANCEATRSYARWLAATLGIEVAVAQDDQWTVTFPEASPGLNGGRVITVAWNEAAGGDDSVDGATFVAWLTEQAHEAGLLHAVPAHAAAAVADVSAGIFRAYTVDDGTVQLSGCTLDDLPFLRVSRLTSNHHVEHMCCTITGEDVGDAPCEALGLESLARSINSPRIADEQTREWLAAGRNAVSADGVVVAVVWCRFAEGGLTFRIGDSSVELPFAGWASLLANGTVQPPPFHCPVTDREGYHLAATDDGQITVVEAIAVCDKSGKRVLETELEVCPVTGQHLLGEHLATCPVSDERIAEDALARCGICHQGVSPSAIERGTCAACRDLQPVRKDDPRLARLLGEHPKLDRWKKWQMSETAAACIFQATGLLQRLLLVVDKDSLELTRIATANRLSARWTDVTDVQRAELLE